MRQSFKDQLKEWKRQQREQTIKHKKKSSRRKPPEKKKEKLTDRDLRFLMGTDRQILSRGKGGAWRNGR